MINIAIIDQNRTYRESLKIVLEQIDGFRVTPEIPESAWDSIVTEIPIHVLIIDGSLGQEQCIRLIRKVKRNGWASKILILAMFREELEYEYSDAEVILKSSAKSQFADKILNMTNNL